MADVNQGHLPPLHSCNPQVPLGLSDIIAKCLASEAVSRYADAGALAADLWGHLNDMPLKGVANRSAGERWRKWRRRKPHLLSYGALVAAIPSARDGWAELADGIFEGLTSTPPSRTFFPDLYARFAEKSAWRVFADVGPALHRMGHLGIKIGLISNWDERLRPLLADLGLARDFDAVIISCEEGVCKPDPAIFKIAAERLGVQPPGVLHVGDSWREDFEGALEAGCRALLVSRHPGAGGAPGIIRSLAEILP